MTFAMEFNAFLYIFIGFLSKSFIGRSTGLCAFSCNFLNKTFDVVDSKEFLIEFQKTSPVTSYNMTVLADGSVFLTECFERSGEFYVLRRLIGTDYFFSCAKNTLHDKNNNFVVYYYTPFTYYPHTPTLCDVCNGTNLFNENLNDVENDCGIVHIPDLGCNLPSVCPVTDPVIQERCPPCNHAFDDGLCCP